MAEVQDPAQTASEPSMEEILASIRKIISDDAPPVASDAAADIIELTQVVEEDGSVVDIAPSPQPEVPPMAAAPEPAPQPQPAPAPAAPIFKPSETLVSEPAASAAGSALSALASTVEIERLSSAPMTSTSFGNGSRTLEDMVIELMRPLLKQWLDENLPATVDRLVQKEIERISRRKD
jgi:cell pole-organizing protein PopZ